MAFGQVVVDGMHRVHSARLVLVQRPDRAQRALDAKYTAGCLPVQKDPENEIFMRIFGAIHAVKVLGYTDGCPDCWPGEKEESA